MQPCFRKDLERRKGSRMWLERADGCKRVNVQLKPAGLVLFFEQQSITLFLSFSRDISHSLAFSLPRCFSLSLSLSVSPYISFSISLFFSIRFSGIPLLPVTTKELVDRLCRARVCVGVMIFELSKPSKAGPFSGLLFCSERTYSRQASGI